MKRLAASGLCAEARKYEYVSWLKTCRDFKRIWLAKRSTSIIFKMAGFEPEEPEFSDDSEYCQAVRIGRFNQDAELTIFYTPKGG